MSHLTLLKFRPKTPPDPRPPEAVKYGLYPLGEDVIMSTPTFETVLNVLTSGTPADQQEVAAILRRMFNSPYSGVLGNGVTG